MEYEGFIVSKKDIESGICISIKDNNGIMYHLYYLTKNPLNDILLDDRSVLIQDYVGENNYNVTMGINLQTKKRYGSSSIGEEFTKFISRYGLRFDRID